MLLSPTRVSGAPRVSRLHFHTPDTVDADRCFTEDMSCCICTIPRIYSVTEVTSGRKVSLGTHEGRHVRRQVVEAQRRRMLQGEGFLTVRDPRHRAEQTVEQTQGWILGSYIIALVLDSTHSHQLRHGAPQERKKTGKNAESHLTSSLFHPLSLFSHFPGCLDV